MIEFRAMSFVMPSRMPAGQLIWCYAAMLSTFPYLQKLRKNHFLDEAVESREKSASQSTQVWEFGSTRRAHLEVSPVELPPASYTHACVLLWPTIALQVAPVQE